MMFGIATLLYFISATAMLVVWSVMWIKAKYNPWIVALAWCFAGVPNIWAVGQSIVKLVN